MVAYEYFYHQVTNDLIGSNIPELVYPMHKDQVAGLCVTNMYYEWVKNNESVENLINNYRKYVPKVYVKKHSFAIKKLISKALNNIQTGKYKS